MRFVILAVVLLGLGVAQGAAAQTFLSDAEVDAGLQRIPYEADFRETRSAAEAGDAAAQFRLGRMYERGHGVDQDLTLAQTWHRRAAQGGNAAGAIGMVRLARHQDLPKGLREPHEPWLRRAVELDSTYRWIELSKELFTTTGTLQDAKARELEEILKSAPNPLITFLIEFTRAFEKATPRARYDEINDALHNAAMALDLEQMRGNAWVGAMVFQALSRTPSLPGGPEATVELRENLWRAAIAGDLQATCNFAFLKLSEKDYGAAQEWYLKAAERGAARASYRLGILHRDGLVPGADPAAAARWFYRAAIQSFPPAQAALGDLLLNGVGVTRNPELARAWLRSGAAFGNQLALYDLGLIYDQGQGVPVDRDRAVTLIARAATDYIQPHSGHMGLPAAKDWIKAAEADPQRAEFVRRALADAKEKRPTLDTDEAPVDCLGRENFGVL